MSSVDITVHAYGRRVDVERHNDGVVPWGNPDLGLEDLIDRAVADAKRALGLEQREDA